MHRLMELSPGFRRLQETNIRGNRTKHVISFNPNSRNPSENIIIEIPKLNPDLCIVPDSIYLLFDFKNKNTKSWFKNNLGKGLQKELRISIHGAIAYENTKESIFSTYKDLWLKNSERLNMVEDGIASLAIRKKLSKDDAQNDDAEAKIALETYGTKQRIQLGKILKDHGLFSGHDLNLRITYNIKLPDAEDITGSTIGESVDGYTLENIELEYETIDNIDLAKQIRQMYIDGRTLKYEHVLSFKSTIWDKGTTVNETIDVPKPMTKGILMLFKEKDEGDPEKFMYPNIENVRNTIAGIPNMIYSNKLPKRRMFEEAQRLFENDMENPEMKALSFFRLTFYI